MSKQLYLEAIEALRQRVAAGDVHAPYGIMLIAEERHRQVAVEGWTAEHDDRHVNGEMTLAAACYLVWDLVGGPGIIDNWWPWSREWWKPKDLESNLVRAGALIAAELDRLRRLQLAAEPPPAESIDEEVVYMFGAVPPNLPVGVITTSDAWDWITVSPDGDDWEDDDLFSGGDWDPDDDDDDGDLWQDDPDYAPEYAIEDDEEVEL